MALSDTVAELEANFTALTTVVSNASAEIAKLAGEVANAGVDPALVARIQAVADGLATQSSTLGAAVTAGG